LSPEEEVLKPYSEILSDFDKSQKLKWIRWKDQLPKRVAEVEKKHLQNGNQADLWQNLTYVFVVISAAIPIIVTILVTIEMLTNAASLIDAMFPAVVGVVQTKLSGSSKRRHAFAQVVSPYRTLLSNIIIDIYEKKYSDEKHEIYQKKWNALNEIIMVYL
jgi:VIT1/CCC1 family predicted Fe2+/Mn2+ transporter